MTNDEIIVINEQMKVLNQKIINGMEKNLSGTYYSSMDMHRRILREHEAIKIILEM